MAFGRVSLNRWNRAAFTQYARERGVPAPDDLFHAVADRLGAEHPVLTRAVLVKSLVDVATDEPDLLGLLNRIGQDPQDYFHRFVDGLVEREARHKWLDTSGDPPQAILTTEEHHELLAMFAQEMWLSATDSLRMDVVSILVDMFASAKKKSPAVARQIGERIKHHALLVTAGFGRAALAFDHEDFRLFYFGQALGRMLVECDRGAVRSTIETAALPASAITEAVSVVRRHSAGQNTLGLLQRLADGELPASFVRENCGALTLALIDKEDGTYEARTMNFPDGSLRQRHLMNVTVSGSYFYATSLAETVLQNCRFMGCHFERLEIDGSENVSGSSLDSECHVDSVVRVDADDQITNFGPEEIEYELRRAGFEMGGREATTDAEPLEASPDNDLRDVQRFLRAFLRANALNESTIRQRLGVKANHFFKSLLPQLVQVGVVKNVSYQGHGDQLRIKLSVPMIRIEDAMSSAGGEFDRFVQAFHDK